MKYDCPVLTLKMLKSFEGHRPKYLGDVLHFSIPNTPYVSCYGGDNLDKITEVISNRYEAVAKSYKSGLAWEIHGDFKIVID